MRIEQILKPTLRDQSFDGDTNTTYGSSNTSGCQTHLHHFRIKEIQPVVVASGHDDDIHLLRRAVLEVHLVGQEMRHVGSHLHPSAHQVERNLVVDGRVSAKQSGVASK